MYVFPGFRAALCHGPACGKGGSRRPAIPLYTFTVVTTAANSLLAPIHHRMPVILAPDQEAAWLDPQLTDADLLGSMLTAYPEEELQLRPVSTLVNSVANDGPECLAPPESPVESRRLL